MANPKRNASGDRILSPSRTFFVTTRTSMGKASTIARAMCAIRNILLRIPLGKDWWTRRRSFLTASPIWQNESQQGLKPNHSHTCAARLKPCPDTKHQGGDSRKPVFPQVHRL